MAPKGMQLFKSQSQKLMVIKRGNLIQLCGLGGGPGRREVMPPEAGSLDKVGYKSRAEPRFSAALWVTGHPSSAINIHHPPQTPSQWGCPISDLDLQNRELNECFLFIKLAASG